MADEALPLSEVLREEYVRLHGDLPAATVAALAAAGGNETARLKAIYAAIHALNEDPAKARAALCISGGGIRSATFALGIMQRLASFGLLTKFDFLSTVSGGGYIGSWLSSFARRDAGGMANVQRGIQGVPAAVRNPLEPEIAPLKWLRRFSNYLTPKLGLMSADTWTFIGSYLRNLLLVWLIFVPFLAAVLALPRLALALLRFQDSHADALMIRNIAILLILIGTATLSFTRPVSYRKKGWLTNGRFLKAVFLPFSVAAVLFAVFWAYEYKERPPLSEWWILFKAFILINVLSSLTYMARYFRELHTQRLANVRSDSTKAKYALKKLGFEMFAAVFAGAAAAGLLYASALKFFNDPRKPVMPAVLENWHVFPPNLTGAPAEVFICFAVPLVLGIMFVQAALFVGLSSWFNEEYDREWWGRAGGWVLFAGVAWIVATAITIYGPVGIYYAPRLYAAIAGGTGLMAILLGKGGATGATDKEKDEKAGPAQTGVNLSLAIVGPLFAIAILALISLCTSLILIAIKDPPRIDPRELAYRAAGTYQVRENVVLDKRPGNFQTSRYPAVDETEIAAIEHLWAVDQTTLKEGLILVLGLAGFSWLISFFFGANQFSLHGLYRNRLVRGYLGASRDDRVPNAFSGFDPTDNLSMDRLRPEAFWPSTFISVAVNGPSIVLPAAGLGIQPATRNAVTAAAAAPGNAELDREARELLSEDLNRAIDTLNLAPAGQRPQSVANRVELEKRFPGAFQPMATHQRPLHVVGTTLNLVAGDNLAWQERKGATFAISPLFSGSPLVGYRCTRLYGGPSGVSLGTAVAISGAAASPNMGYNSSPALSFLLTLFNVRLGWWLGNPKKSTYGNRNPSNTLLTVLDEAFGVTDENHNYVYLSDGGHFDNLGLYEMVLRRCHCIIVSDAGADPDFGFQDLGNAIRKIRIDLGIDIEITQLDLFPRSKKDPDHPKYCAVAKIHYGAVDPGAKDGCLLYLKPAFYGKYEPKDVYNYASSYQAFPHQSTGDQWFSESQFESYRQLGFFAAGEVAKGKASYDTVCELITEADRYLAKDKPTNGKDAPTPLVC